MRYAPDLDVQLGVAVLALVPPFVAEDQGRLVVAKAQQVLCEVQLDVGIEARARHLFRMLDHRLELTTGTDAAELPHQRPELLRRTDREVVQRRVALDVLVARLVAYEPHETVHVGAFNTFLAGFPDWLVHQPLSHS